MADEDVSLSVRARETVSKAFKKIEKAIRDTNDEVGDLGDRVAAASAAVEGATEGMENSFDEVDDEIDEVNRALQQLVLTAPAARAAIESIGDVDLDDPKDFLDLREEQLPSELIRSDLFRNQLVGRIADDDMSGPARGRVSGALASMQNVETVGELADRLEEFNDVERDTSRLLSDIRNSARDVGEQFGILETQKRDTADAEDSMNFSTRRLMGNIAREGSLMRGLGNTLREMTDETDDMSDGIERASKVMDRLLLSSANLSANIGPFNVALGELGSTFFGLAMTIGPLITIIGGLASAILAVVAAAGAFAALGFVQLMEHLQETFIGIEDNAQAMEAIFKGLKTAIMEALAPLQGVTIAGLGPMELAVQVMRDLVTMVNLLADGFADIIAMPVVQDFLLRMRSALLGVGEAGEETAGFFEALEGALQVFLPAAGDFLIWLMAALPAFLKFSERIGRDLIPVLRSFGPVLLAVMVRLAEVGTFMLTALLPTFEMALRAFIGLMDIISIFTDPLGGVIKDFIGLLAILGIVSFVLARLAFAIELVVAGVQFLSSVGAFSAIAQGVTALVGAVATLLGVSTAVAAGIIIVAVAIVGALVWIALNWEKTKDMVGDAVETMMNAASNWADATVSQIQYVIKWFDKLLGKFDEGIGRAFSAAMRGDVAGVGDALAGSTDEAIGRMTSDVSREPRRSGSGPRGRGAGTNVNVTVNNNGSGRLGERDAQRVGDAAARRIREERRRSDGSRGSR